MKKQVEEANNYLVHNVRNSIVNLKLIQKQLYRISLDIEKAFNIYREMIDDLVEEYENRLSDGNDSEAE